MTKRTEVHRAPQKQVFDPEVAQAIIARAIVAHVTITHIDALVLARSSFESSMHYQSLMALGSAREIEKEINATAIVAFPLNEISVKVSNGQPNDSGLDLDSDVWAGILPLTLTYGVPVAAENLRPGISVPDYITSWPAR